MKAEKQTIEEMAQEGITNVLIRNKGLSGLKYTMRDNGNWIQLQETHGSKHDVGEVGLNTKRKRQITIKVKQKVI